MIVIQVKKTKATTVNYIIQENPSPGTWGEYQLLRQMLWEQDEDYSNWGDDVFADLNFTTEFLKRTKEEFGELHCEYCGKPDLRIYKPKEKKGPDMATGDHFLPKSIYSELRFVFSNMIVACEKCNNNKKDYIWSISEVKYPYQRK